MKNIFLVSASLALMTACGDDMLSEDNESNEEIEEEQVRDDSFEDNEANNSEQEENTSEPSKEDQEADLLENYSTDEIEYARVWLEIKDNTDIEELTVSYISEGEQVNRYDEDSVDYPEAVVLLAGKGVAGSPVIVYSSNGDGTINLYNVPSHWPSEQQIDETMEEYTRDIIENTQKIYIDPGDDEEVVNLIEKIQVNN